EADTRDGPRDAHDQPEPQQHRVRRVLGAGVAELLLSADEGSTRDRAAVRRASHERQEEDADQCDGARERDDRVERAGCGTMPDRPLGGRQDMRQRSERAERKPRQATSIRTLPTALSSTAAWASAVRSSGKRWSGSPTSSPTRSTPDRRAVVMSPIARSFAPTGIV